MSEVLNAKATSREASGFSRRRVIKGVAWSLPVIATAIAAPAAAASVVPMSAVTPASASITSGSQTVTSTVSSAHDRTNVTMPTTLSLKDLGSVVGNIEVRVTISPAPQAIGAVTLSTVHVGSAPVTVVTSMAGNTFTAIFTSALQAGATQIAFTLGGFSYSGKKQDSGTFDVTTLITFQEGGQTKQLTPGSTVTLVKLSSP